MARRLISRMWLVQRVFGVVLLLSVLSSILTACGSQSSRIGGQASRPTPSLGSAIKVDPQIRQQLIQGRVVVPPCLALLRPTPTGGVPLMFGSSVMTPQVQPTLGFQPLLPTNLPSNVTWNQVFTEGRTGSALQGSSFAVLPLLHATYRFVMPNQTRFDPTAPALLALDETTAALVPPTQLILEASTLHQVDQISTTVGSMPARIIHYAPAAENQQNQAAVFSANTRITVLVWQDGHLTLRLTSMRQGSSPLSFSDISDTPPFEGSLLGQLVAWSGADDSTLLTIARSVRPYTGCTHLP